MIDADNIITRLVGKKIKRIFMNEEYLKFETDKGNVAFTVYGVCCSHSYFHDFLGVDKLLKNGPVVSAQSISLSEDDPIAKTNSDEYEEIECYGYEIVTEDPEFGEVTSVFSFRNSSNGYYGGWMERASDDVEVLPELTADVLEAKS